MKRLIEAAVKRPIGTAMIFLALIFMGIISISNQSIEFLPNIDIPSVVVSTSWPAASPADVRKLVTIPLENALSSAKGLKDIKSVSRNSLSTIELNFDWNVKIIEAELQVREILDTQYSILPEDVYKPRVIPAKPNNEALMIISFFADNIDEAGLRKKIDREIRTELQQIEGVGKIIYAGGADQELVISYDPSMLTSRGISPKQLASQFRQSHNRYPAGSFIKENKEYLIIGDSEFKTVSAIEKTNFRSANNQFFRLGEIADIRLEKKEQRSLFYSNGKEGIGLIIYKQSGANPVAVSNAIKKELPRIRKNFGSVFSYNIVKDSSKYSLKIIKSIISSIILGSLIAFFVLFFVTKRMVVSLLIIISLPVSFIMTGFFTSFFGVSINIMSLGGMAVAIGMLVDNSVIVLENIDIKRARGLSIAEATIQVAGANLGSTLTSIIVFFPLIFLPGIVGAVYKDLAITVATALLASYIVSISLIPSLYNVFKNKEVFSLKKDPILWLTQIYRKSLKRVFRNRRLFLLILSISFAITIITVVLVDIRLSPPAKNTEILIDITAPSGIRMQELSVIADQIYLEVSEKEWFESIYFRAGAEPDDSVYYANPKSTSNVLHGFMAVNIKNKRKFNGILDFLKNDIILSESYSINVYKPAEEISKLFGIDKNGKNYLFSADTTNQIKKIGDEVASQKIACFPADSNTFVEVLPNRNYIDRAGLTPADVSNFIKNQSSGMPVGKIDFNNDPIDIKFRHKKSPYLSIEEIASMKIPLSEQSSIKTGELSTLKEKTQPSALYRENRKDCLLVTIEEDEDADFLTDYSLGNVKLTAVDKSILSKNIREIGIIFIIALIFLYLYLGFQFESFSVPLIILSTVPLSLSGVFTALLITSQSLNISSGIGLLVLFGIVVNSAILLRERTTQLFSKAHSGKYCIINGSIERFRPILITTLTTIFSLIPVALEVFGSTHQQGLAVVVIGGLGVSTILSLFVIPVLLGLKK